MSSVAKIFNTWINRSYSSLAGKLQPRKNRKCCYNCKKTFPHFTKFRGGFAGLNPWLLSLDMVGSDIDNFGCPRCGINDRARHLLMYFDRLGLWSKFENARLLHFAPEYHLEAKIREQHPDQYIKADLQPGNDSIQRIDIVSIPYSENTFDIVICNHVLEHVTDFRKALSEIHRVIKPGGFAILQTPYSRKLESNFEDETINTEELRLKFYGQEDHVRWFSEKQLFNSFSEAGFRVCRMQHAALFGPGTAAQYGVNANEDLMMVEK